MADFAQRIRDLEEQLARALASRAELEHALRESEARFRSIARNLSEMVLAYDMDRRLTFANSAVQALTGYSPAELEKQQFIGWIHADDRDRFLALWSSLFEGQAFHEEEYRLVTRDGRVKWMAASWEPLLDESGRQVGVQGREREVTEHRMAEENLRIREQRYRTLFEDAPFPMWEEDFSAVKEFLDRLQARGVTDLGAHLASQRSDAEECVRRIRVLDVNRAALEFYRATREQLLGDLNLIFDDAAYRTFSQEIGLLAANHATFRTEVDTRTLAGEPRTVTMIVSLASPGDWSRVIVSFFDITDRKRLEERALQSQKLESLGRLASGVAHDFNNLLMVITGYSDLVLADAALPPELRASLTEIRNAGERGAELTRQLVAFSRKQAGQPRPLSLNALIRESQSMLERVIGEDVELAIRLEPDAWTIRADRGQIHQALMNLVVNAREALHPGGVVTIETRNTTESSGDFICLCVSDTGVGMDAHTRQRVFEPFFTTKTSSRGTGLGLATVFGAVTQAGGHVAVSSNPGQGSVFSLYFPRMLGPARHDPLPDPHPAPGSAPTAGTVLLVEDQAEVRRLAGTILRRMGFTVLEAADAEQALTLARIYDGNICLMLTDVIMPGLNGRELAERMAQLRPRTKVIFMSGYTDRILTRDGRLDPSVAYVQKPFSAEQLSAIVRRVLR